MMEQSMAQRNRGFARSTLEVDQSRRRGNRRRRFYALRGRALRCDPTPSRRFGCFTNQLHAITDWLHECGVTIVAMESTGVYWIPLYEVLERRGFGVALGQRT